LKRDKINLYLSQNLAVLSQNQQMENGSIAELIFIICVSKQHGLTAHTLRSVGENLLYVEETAMD
jgi:hypothetical protein